MSISGCHQKYPASQNVLSHHSRTWKKRINSWSASGGTGQNGREEKILVMLFYLPTEKMQNSPWIKSACDSMTGNKDENFHPGAIKSKFWEHFQQIAIHILGLRIVPSLKLQKWKQHKKLQIVNFIFFLSHSMAIPEVLLLLMLISLLLSECLSSRHYFSQVFIYIKYWKAMSHLLIRLNMRFPSAHLII